MLFLCCYFFFFFFFKQKTAYEMRISDWSSDVCSSDLNVVAHRHGGTAMRDQVIREGGDPQMVEDGVAAFAEVHVAVEQRPRPVGGGAAGAGNAPFCPACVAGAAAGHEGEADALSQGEVVDIRPQGDDAPAGFMSPQHGQRAPAVSVDDGQVRLEEAGRPALD